MQTLDSHPCFRRWEDPQTGVASYVLLNDAFPLQKALYYITPSMCGPNRYLWFRGCHPPSQARHLGVVDLQARDRAAAIRAFPGTLGAGGPTSEATPLVTPEGDAAYVAVNDGIYLQHVDGTIREIGRLPADILKGRHLFRLVTDITMSCDAKHLLLDSRIGNRWLISTMEIATGKVTPLRWFTVDHTHVAFSLHDPKLIQMNQGHGFDSITGERYEMNVRMWLMDTDLTRYEPVDPKLWFGRNSRCCHEWWTRSGRLQWCDYDRGIVEIDLETREQQLVWPRPSVHGQCDRSERYLCADVNPYNWNDRLPCGVWCFDRQTQREVAVVTRMPPQPLPWDVFRAFHIDPHPHFSDDGEYLIYTTTALGPVSLAIAPMADIRRRLA